MRLGQMRKLEPLQQINIPLMVDLPMTARMMATVKIREARVELHDPTFGMTAPQETLKKYATDIWWIANKAFNGRITGAEEIIESIVATSLPEMKPVDSGIAVAMSIWTTTCSNKPYVSFDPKEEYVNEQRFRLALMLELWREVMCIMNQEKAGQFMDRT